MSIQSNLPPSSVRARASRLPRLSIKPASERVMSIGVPLGREHNPELLEREPQTMVRLGDQIFDLDQEATMLWSQGLRFLPKQDLVDHAKAQGIAGDPVAKLLSAGLLRVQDQSCVDLAIVPLGMALGNREQTPEIFEINIGAKRPIGVDPLVFAVWSGSYWGRPLRAACSGVAKNTGLDVDAIAMHVLNQCDELLGTVFWLDVAAGVGR